MKKSIQLLSTILAILACGHAARAEFIAEDFVTGQSFITTVAFSPNGNMYFMEKNTGRIKIVMAQGTVRPDPFFTLRVNSQGERGGLGLTFHPDYPDSPYVYCYATLDGPVLANAVVRFVDSLGYGTHPDTIFRAPITVGATNHNGGNIRFGPQGKLYITMGENAQPSWSQDTCRVQGKIIRINYDGSIPDDNPIHCAPLFAYGLRNSYDFCFHPATGALYASENGPDANDEVNLILPGHNYGWPVVQCSSNDPGFTDPIHCWPQVIAPTGIVVAWNSNMPEFNGKLLVTDWNTGTLRSLTLNSSGDSVINEQQPYHTDFGLIDVDQGPDGNIYITKYDGSIIRIRPPGNVPSPFALAFPGDNDPVVVNNILFTWESSTDFEGPVGYHLQIATDKTFNSPLFDLGPFQDTQAVVMADSLFAHGRAFFWRATATDSEGHTTIGGLPLAGWRRLRVLEQGDANGNGHVNGIDVTFILNYLKGFGRAPNPLAAADINADCIVNGLDIIYLVNYFKGGPLITRPNCAP